MPDKSVFAKILRIRNKCVYCSRYFRLRNIKPEMNKYADVYWCACVRKSVTEQDRKKKKEKIHFFFDFFTLFEVNYSYVIHGVFIIVCHSYYTHLCVTKYTHAHSYSYSHLHIGCALRIEARFVV